MKVFKYQQWHILILITLLLFLYCFVKTDDSFLIGELWSINTFYWFLFTLLSPIIHQVYVLVCWRSELHYKSISNMFGKKGFKLYKIGFAILILSRPVTITLLAISNEMTLGIDPLLSYIIAGLLLIPAIYLFYSVKKYFGI